ncbi:MAG: long-chain fatty acid--CoA ligase [Planctomycetes bacterium]|nr:long-chain fatty acid--CoA ligase [Planctomycetota bacterium]
MRRLQSASAILLSVPLIGSAANHAFGWVKPPMSDGSRGAQMWDLIREGGLMNWLAAGHLLLGILLLVPRTRFAAGLMQLPVTLGIVVFNVTMFPRGIALAIGMLVVNLGVVLNPRDLRRLLAPSAG